jgi:DNA-binding MarR family transcriptional regulator
LEYSFLLSFDKGAFYLKISIGIITAERSVELIMKAHDGMSRMCGVKYLPYSSASDLARVYDDNARLFDGLIFSGRFPYCYIKNHAGAIPRPHAYFELTDRDYYRAFAGILHRFPGINVSRILIDKPYADVDFAGVFGGQVPAFLDALGDAASLENAYEKAMLRSLDLWQDGKIDLVVTRFTNLAEPLRASGVSFELLFPSAASMLDVCGAICGLIQSRRLVASMVASGVVSCVGPERADADKKLARLLRSFNEKNGMPLVIRENGDASELTTSNRTLDEITRGYTDCALTSYLQGELGTNVCVGWGLGAEVVSSNQNAVRAFRESMRSASHHAYLVNDLGNIIGPMTSGKSVTMSGSPDAGAEEIGRRLGISPANLQKMIDLWENREISTFSSADLAFYLNITPRSAGRILSRLAEHGAAGVVRNGHPNAKGRPYKIYGVDCEKLRSGNIA